MNKYSFIALSVLAASFTTQANEIVETAAASTQISAEKENVLVTPKNKSGFFLQGGVLLSETSFKDSHSNINYSNTSFTIDGGYLFKNNVLLGGYVNPNNSALKDELGKTDIAGGKIDYTDYAIGAYAGYEFANGIRLTAGADVQFYDLKTSLSFANQDDSNVGFNLGAGYRFDNNFILNARISSNLLMGYDVNSIALTAGYQF